MRRVLLGLCLIMPFTLFAQKDTSLVEDYSKIFGSRDDIITRRLCTIDNLMSRKPEYKKPTNELDRRLMVADSAILSFKKKLIGQDMILADVGTITSIQNKLSNISAEYKKYLYRDKNLDSGSFTTSVYYLDGKRLGDGWKDTVFELYKLKSDDIKSIKLERKDDCNYILVREYSITITTKK